jgi:hypothetical protein
VGAAVVKTYNAVENIANARASMMVMEAQGRAGTEEYKALNTATDAMIEKLPTAQQTLVEANIIGSGKNLYKKYQEEQSRRTGGGTGAGTGGTQGGVQGGGTGAGTGGTQGGVQGGGTGGVQGGGQGGGQGAGNGGSQGGGGRPNTPVGGGMPAAKPTPGGVSGGGQGTVTKEVSTPSGTKTVSSTGYGQGGSKTENRRATGGLIMKPQKTAPKTKGLAGKQ